MNDFDIFALHTKKEWALYCHEYLLNVLHEKDDADWSAARILTDIYDCRTCVYHIAQTYVKGIIPALDENKRIFGSDTIVPQEQAALYLKRLTDKNERLKVEKITLPKIRKIEKSKIVELENPIIIDIQDEKVFNSIRQNPYGVSSDLFQNIVLTCSRGYQSTLLADILLKSGFRNIYISTVLSAQR